MPTQIETFAAGLQDATERRTVLALSKVDLFQSTLEVTAQTTDAEFTAAVATYDGYAQQTFTAWFAPYLGPGQGWIIESPLVIFAVGVVDPVVGNLIGGYVVRDAAGKVRLAVTFDDSVDMSFAGAAIPISAVVAFPVG